MDRNEILEKSRRENKGADEWELKVQTESGSIAGAVGAVICMAITLFCAIVDRHDHPAALGAWAVMEAMMATRSLYQFAKLRKKSALVWGCLLLVLAIFFLMRLVISVME